MKLILLLLACVLLYLQVLFPLVDYLDARPFVEKLGYVPQENFLRFSTADQKTSTSAALVFKTMMYFGGLVQESTGKAKYIPPDYEGMIQNIKTAIKLDPYNMDAYYFAQAILTWDTGRITEANDILEFGMRYRDWDFYLPYFAGFNYAYFLKDYKNAARYYKRAADLTGNDLLIRLTSRYLYESRQTELAIAYLKNMKRTAHNQAVKQSLEIRLRALEEIRRVEIAIEKFTKKTGHRPNSLKELLENGYLESEPVDPYGGHIFLDEMGQVKVSSQLAKVKDNNERD